MSRYIYLDDAEKEDMQTFVESLQTAASDQGLHLDIEIQKPPSDLRLDELLNKFAPNGLLIDVELDKAMDDSDRPYPMTGTALAQNIRDNQNAGKVAEIPLVRLSQAVVVRKYVGKDHTSLDLFDRFFDKAHVLESAPKFAEELVALDAGYQKLGAAAPFKIDAFPWLLGIDDRYFQNLNPTLILRCVEHADAPAHDVARFISQALLMRDGPLIGEATLATRLGIDLARSGTHWTVVLNALESTRYAGIFATASDPRWWADLVAEWWRSLKDVHEPLIDSPGQARCAAIAESLGIELHPIQPDESSPGEYYWTNCIESGRALDPMHAYAVTPDSAQREWHDLRYMCRGEAFHHARDQRFDASERERILQDRG